MEAFDEILAFLDEAIAGTIKRALSEQSLDMKRKYTARTDKLRAAKVIICSEYYAYKSWKQTGKYSSPDLVWTY